MCLIENMVAWFGPTLVLGFVLSAFDVRGEGNLAGLLNRLEYDQEIKGLFVPKGYFDNRGSLLIGSARIVPSSTKLYALGWSPALQLQSIRYGGSAEDFFHLATNLAKNSRSDLYLSRLTTEDGICEADYFISKYGQIKPGL